jgi:outer membrane protein TolC
MSLLTTWKPQSRMATITGIAACYMNIMVDPVGTARGSRHTPSGYASWIAATPACLIIAILVLAGGVLCWCPPALGADQNPAAYNLAPGNSLNFEESVKIAIHQCPYFTKSSLEIDIRRMDETDSRYGMVPPLTFYSYYYVNRPSGMGGSKPYSLNFVTDPYNPFGSYLTLQAQKLITQAAILAHLKTISKGLERLGSYYLELDALNKLARYQKDLIKLAQENLTYVKNRMGIGTATSLEVKMAQGELDLAQGEQESIALAQKRTLSNLKNFLALPSTQDFTPDFRNSQRQVLGRFTPATVSLELTKNRSYELKAFEIQEKLQGYNVSLAVAKVFPTILFTTQTPNPLSYSTEHGLYVGFGLQVPVWDGFKRIRNISRQKAMLKQLSAKKKENEDVLETKFHQGLEKIQEQEVGMKNAQSREELARLKAQQKEVRYQSGQAPLSELLESRQVVLKAQKENVRKTLLYDEAVLSLREISGDLGNTYVDASSWQK